MDSRPVGFFDSGLGGISVLRAARKLLPCEDYLYYGDSANAPYGTKTPEEILALSDAVVQKLLSREAKAIVVACNTATGEAVDTLRKTYPQVPFIGVEPAVKPAVTAHPGQRILVLATPQCLQSRRVRSLLERFSDEASPIPVPCEGLMEFVERGEFSGVGLDAFLQQLLAPYLEETPAAAVLGCTHYPFLSEALRRNLPPCTELIDGNGGIAARLRQILTEGDLLNPRREKGCVQFDNSLGTADILARSRMLLELP